MIFHGEPIPLTVWVQCSQLGVGVWEFIPGGYLCPSLLLLEPYQEVHVRQTMFLKLYGIDMGHRMTQDALVGDQIKELFLLELEYTCHQVWMVFRCLTWR